MSEYQFLIMIASVLFVGAMSPGPSFLIVARNALSLSRAHGIATAFGTGLGVAFFAIIANLGVVTLLEQSPVFFKAFKIMGGLYLLYISYLTWVHAKEKLQQQDQDQNKQSLLKSFLSGFITQTSNPKTIIVIAGIFAAFMPVNPPPLTSVLIPLIAFVIDFSWYALIALGLSNTIARKKYAQIKPYFDRLAALFLGFVGLKLMFL